MHASSSATNAKRNKKTAVRPCGARGTSSRKTDGPSTTSNSNDMSLSSGWATRERASTNELVVGSACDVRRLAAADMSCQRPPSSHLWMADASDSRNAKHRTNSSASHESDGATSTLRDTALISTPSATIMRSVRRSNGPMTAAIDAAIVVTTNHRQQAMIESHSCTPDDDADDVDAAASTTSAMPLATPNEQHQPSTASLHERPW